MRGDLQVVEPARDVLEDLPLAAREVGERGGGARAGTELGTNASISSITRSKEGSPGIGTWLRVSSGTSRAPGIDEARNTPSSNGAHMSPRVCRTSVGHVTRGRYADASMSLKLRDDVRGLQRRARHALQIVERADLLGRRARETSGS